MQNSDSALDENLVVVRLEITLIVNDGNVISDSRHLVSY